MGNVFNSGRTGNVFSGLQMRPFDRDRDIPADLGLGGLSTEYTVTNESPDGGFWNIPSIWWTPDGVPAQVGPDSAQAFAMEYEQRTGKKFPPLPRPRKGVLFAMSRSANGGGS